MLGTAIGAGVGAIGSIFGGISASKAMKKVKANLEAQQAANRNWYDRNYNEDATQRASAHEMITKTEEAMRERNKQAAAAQPVMGGTEESVAATKAANARAMADTASAIAVNAERRKDAIEAQYQAKDEALQSQLNDMERQKAAGVAAATQGVTQAGANMAEFI